MELNTGAGGLPAMQTGAGGVHLEPAESAAAIDALASCAQAAREAAARLEAMPESGALRDPGNPDAPPVAELVEHSVDAAATATRVWADMLADCAGAVTAIGREIAESDAETAHALRAAAVEGLG